MAATLTFHPLGDDDSTLIDLAAALRADLARSGRDGYDAVMFTRLDRDHVYGAGEFFLLEHSKAFQGAGRARIGELWLPAPSSWRTSCPTSPRSSRPRRSTGF